MIMDMPRPRPPHLHRQTTRHGVTVWYVRIGKGRRTRIRAAYGTPEFTAEYDAAVAGKPMVKKGPENGTLHWLWDRYRETGAWRGLSQATRRQRENIMKHVLAASGHEPYRLVTKKSVAAGSDRRSDTPAQARNFLDAMRGIFRWALSVDHVKIDPTAGVANPERKTGKGFPEWTEADVETFERRWPLGTRQRVWLHVLLYLGPRRGDAHRVGRQHMRGNELTFTTEKTDTEVTLPILPPLAASLKAGPVGDLTFICGERGYPLTKESFGNMFSEAARQAGIKKSAHGVRKIAATRCAEAGATVHQLNAIFGWSGTTMAMLYTQAAGRKRLAREAANMLLGTPVEQPIPSPDNTVRAETEK